MNIALIAQDSKKELMVDFCIAYKAILEKHTLYATGTTGNLIIKGAELPVHRLSPGPLGGEEQLEAKISCNEIDLVIILRDSIVKHGQDSDMASILRNCDINNIPFATNIATAEVLINGLERGDLAWRELI